MSHPSTDLGDVPMDELFRQEVEEHAAVLTAGLLAAERGERADERLTGMLRAAHSIKGAARVVGREAAVHVAHALEDAFVAAQAGTVPLAAGRVDALLEGVDLLMRLSAAAEAAQDGAVRAFLAKLGDTSAVAAVAHPGTSAPAVPAAGPATATAATVRLTADQLNRLLGLAGESVVASRWIGTFGGELLALRRRQQEVARTLDEARAWAAQGRADRAAAAVDAATAGLAGCHAAAMRAIGDFDAFDRRFLHLSHRLYEEVLASRMQPFADATRGLARLVRDLARDLGKEARLVLVGEGTPVDRDVLRRLEAPLVHLLRNALDHGLEAPSERIAAGKGAEGTLRIEASHLMGQLVVTVEDDGRGLDPEAIRARALERGLTTPEVAARLGTTELLEFLLLPGFSTANTVTEISGRGVGLDVVQTVVREIGGRIELSSTSGGGTRVRLQLPLTLSLLRALVVRVAGEPYAVPLSRVVRVARVPRSEVHSVEGREHFESAGRAVGLLGAREILGLGATAADGPDLAVVVLGDQGADYGLVVDALLGQEELVVRSLDPRLGKVANISAAAVLPDGSPVLIVDVDDLVRSTAVHAGGGRIASGAAPSAAIDRARRILVADDSITVRETERKLLQAAGYEVDVAVDGMEAWNALRAGHYDLLLTDVDMPRLDGIELTRLVRADHRLHRLPVMVVSYKDREEDRRRGLDAGADYYLTKASFHDDTLLRATAMLLAEVTA